MYSQISTLLFASAFGLTLCSCGNETHDSETNSNSSENTIETTSSNQISEDVDAARFQELIGEGKGILIDVRTPEEFSGGHIQGAVNLDFNGGQFESSLDTLNKETPVYVYCQAGGRSGKAKNMLHENGFGEVYNLIGGYGAWPYK